MARITCKSCGELRSLPLIDAGKDQSIAPVKMGGLVSHCYIDGKIMKDPGDIGGDGSPSSR